jgi:hypothetical protein
MSVLSVVTVHHKGSRIAQGIDSLQEIIVMPKIHEFGGYVGEVEGELKGTFTCTVNMFLFKKGIYDYEVTSSQSTTYLAPNQLPLFRPLYWLGLSGEISSTGFWRIHSSVLNYRQSVRIILCLVDYISKM